MLTGHLMSVAEAVMTATNQGWEERIRYVS